MVVPKEFEFCCPEHGTDTQRVPAVLTRESPFGTGTRLGTAAPFP
jgi:hypothetical protein